MLLMSRHLQALDALAASETAGHEALPITEDAVPAFRVLQLDGLALPQAGLSYSLSSEGREAVRLLETMRHDSVLPAYREKDAGWRFLGSEILAALEAAARTGHIGPATIDLLQARGFATPSHEGTSGIAAAHLNTHGAAWLTLARRTWPHLEITHELAAQLLSLPMGYFRRRPEGISVDALAALEAMELIAWSAPEGDYGTFTALGGAVVEAVQKGGYPATDAVLDDVIAREVEEVSRWGAIRLPAERLSDLQLLGYLTEAGTLSAAGEAVLRARQLARAEAAGSGMVPSFAITHYEVEVLRSARELAQREEGAIVAPTRIDLHRALVDRLEERYQDFVHEYGHTIMLERARKQQAQAIQREMHEHERAYGGPAELDALLVSLESCDLLRAERGEGPERRYRLTRAGWRVLEAQGEPPETPRDISSSAVKAVAAAGTAPRFGAVATAWVEQAFAEGLLGSRGISYTGTLYAELAWTGKKRPTLSRFEAEMLVGLPAIEAPDVIAKSATGREQDRRRRWALDKLEARGLSERLIDGQVALTERGKLVARAVGGALELAFPVTPALLRLLAAIEALGETLYVQEEKVHETAEQWERLAHLTGLDPDPLREEMHLAKLGQYLGDAGLTEAGHTVLAAYRGSKVSGEQPGVVAHVGGTTERQR
ncbi:MAG: DUF505 family protein [Ktedonobacterales bacterium]